MSHATAEHAHVHHEHAFRPHGRYPDLAVRDGDGDARIDGTLAETKLLVLLPMVLRHLALVNEEHDEAAEDGCCACNICRPVMALHFTLEALYAQLQPQLHLDEATRRRARKQLLDQERRRREEAESEAESRMVVLEANRVRVAMERQEPGERQDAEPALINWPANLPAEDDALLHAERLEDALARVRDEHAAREDDGVCGCEACEHSAGFAFLARMTLDTLSGLFASPNPRRKALYEAQLRAELVATRVQVVAEHEVAVAANDLKN